MNDIFRCGDQEALVAYLYEECEPDARDAIAAHLSGCPACAEEVAALQATRGLLAAWAPPDASLGFQVTGAAERPEPTVLRPAAWWRQPLPAWAQAAAAVLIFAAGVAAGGLRGLPSAAVPTPAQPVPVAARAADDARIAPVVSRDDLGRLEQRLRAIETAQARLASAPAPRAVDEAAVLQRVRALIDERLTESEGRQRVESMRMLADVARDVDVQQRELEQRMAARVAAATQMHGVTVQELKQQQDTLNSLFPRVSFQQPVRRR